MGVTYKVYCPICCKGIVRNLAIHVAKDFRFTCRECGTGFSVNAKALLDKGTRIKGDSGIDRSEGYERACASK